MRVFSFTHHSFVRFTERIDGPWKNPDHWRTGWNALYDAARTAVLLDDLPEGEGRFFRCSDPAMLWIAKREEGVWVVITVLQPDATAGKIDDAVKEWLTEQEEQKRAEAIMPKLGAVLTPPMAPRPIEVLPSGLRPRDLGAWTTLELSRAAVERARLKIVATVLSTKGFSADGERLSFDQQALERQALNEATMAKARSEKTERHRLNMVRDWLLVRAWQRLSKVSDDEANAFLVDVAQHMKVSPEDLADMWLEESTKMQQPEVAA